MPDDYDLITIGGGMAGAALALSLAPTGLRVLVLERERQFRDRIRGEQMQPWGVAEARELGILDLLKDNGGHEQPWVDLFHGGAQMGHRNLAETTLPRAPHFNFYHPAMQETLSRAAQEAGAEVRRGAVVRELRPGGAPAVVVEHDGATETLGARLIAAADGRGSVGRKWPGFTVRQDPPFLMIAGVLLDDMKIPEDTGVICTNSDHAQGAYLFPQGGGRVRAYSAYAAGDSRRIQGEKDLPDFIKVSVGAGAPPGFYEGVRPAGPLGSFEAADTWVEHPYAGGVALVGDAAAASDPSWGQGLSLTLRDVRVLRDALMATDDWDRAGHEYAMEHDRYYGVMHEVTHAFKDMFMRPGGETNALRARALPRIGQDPTRIPDHLFSGPDLPWNEGVRRVFFGLD